MSSLVIFALAAAAAGVHACSRWPERGPCGQECLAHREPVDGEEDAIRRGA